jgi:hypothetical protein
MQCPEGPGTAALVQAFQPFEREVLACNPPAGQDGRLTFRATFSATGDALEFHFPGMRMDRDRGLCVGRALCRARVPTFRLEQATVDYDYVVFVPQQR